MSGFKYWLLLIAGITFTSSALANTTVDGLLQEYRQQGASEFSATAGKVFWQRNFRAGGADTQRSCTSCHTADLRQIGKHVKTGKEIKPLAPSVMSKRLTNSKKIRKWLKRNCLWTVGRECTAQEKGDVLQYLKDL
jgi:hypothetical protein